MTNRRRLVVLRDATSLVAVDLEPPGKGRGVQRRPLAHAARDDADLALLEAWTSLSDARPWTESTAVHAIRVVLETVPAPRAPRPGARPPPEPPEPPRASARHPRGFRGTTHQPPKGSHGEARDLRPLLLAPGTGRAWLRRLVTRFPDAHQHLAIPPHALERWIRTGGDPYLVVHHGAPAGASLARQSAALSDCFLPLLRGVPWRRVLAFDRWLRGLARAQVAAPLDATDLLEVGGFGLDWLLRLGDLPTAAAAPFTRALRDAGAEEFDPASLPSPRLAQLGIFLEGKYLEARCRALVAAILADEDLDYLRVGFELATRHCPSFPFKQSVPGPGPSAVQLEATMPPNLLDDPAAGDWTRRPLLQRWQTAGQNSTVARWVHDPPWAKLSASRRAALWKYVPDDVRPQTALLDAWLEILPTLADEIAAVSEACADKFVDLTDTVYDYCDEPSELRRLLPSLYPVFRALCSRPSQAKSESPNWSWAWARLAAALGARASSLATIPAAAFLAVEDELGSSHSQDLIERGLGRLALTWPDRTLKALAQSPRKLTTVAFDLAALPRPRRRGLRAWLEDHPASRVRAHTDPPDSLLRELLASLPDTAISAFPRRLRRSLAGEEALTAGQRTSQVARLKTGLLVAELDVLAGECRRRVLEPLGWDDDDAAVHAAQLLETTEENQAALRRCLRALRGGRSPDDEVANQTWLAARAGLRRGRWRSGIRMTRAVPPLGTLHLAFEDDPIEVLRMGTYVGSCLRLGGSFSYAAAAVLLDANKQVIYARDGEGRVRARQLVALTDDLRLVCYAVYAIGAPEPLHSVFTEFDRRLASSLGTPIVGGDEDYEVTRIVSEDWWDDSAWDMPAF